MNNRILVVDDSAFMRNFLKNILVSNGYNIIGEASNGEEAIKLYKSLNPNLVTMDITMPIMNGIQALTQIKQLDENAKIIMITAMGQKVLINEAINAGATDFIIKPFQADAIIKTIEKYI